MTVFDVLHYSVFDYVFKRKKVNKNKTTSNKALNLGLSATKAMCILPLEQQKPRTPKRILICDTDPIAVNKTVLPDFSFVARKSGSMPMLSRDHTPPPRHKNRVCAAVFCSWLSPNGTQRRGSKAMPTAP